MTETGIESRGIMTPRSMRSSGDVRASMDGCTKCGICHAHCPVAAVTGDFPGPKFTGPQAERFRVIGSVAESAPDLCSGCGICMDVCPNDVAVTDIITLAKADQVARDGGVSFGQKLLNRPDLLGSVGSAMPWLANGILSNSMMRAIGETLFGIDKTAPLPRFAGRRFRRWLEAASQPDGPTIGYFSGCAVEHYDADVGIATVKLLNRLGYRVEVPSSACCSLPMLSSGEWEAARPRAQTLVTALAPAAKSFEAIVGTSTSCTLTLRSKYAAYLDMVDGTASAVADKVSDIGMFLLDNHADELRDRLSRNTTHVLYHGPCQLRGHKAGQPSAELLSLVPGLQLELSQASCCGVAGTYGYQKAKRHIAVDVGTGLMEQIKRSKPALVLCDSETCRWNIEAATGVPTQHPVQFLLECMK
jgi:glycerol-3-phosphate dehydrogenase subunit C